MALCLCGASYIYCFHLPFYRFQKVTISAKTGVVGVWKDHGGRLLAGKLSCTSGEEGSNMWKGKLLTSTEQRPGKWEGCSPQSYQHAHLLVAPLLLAISSLDTLKRHLRLDGQGVEVGGQKGAVISCWPSDDKSQRTFSCAQCWMIVQSGVSDVQTILSAMRLCLYVRLDRT